MHAQRMCHPQKKPYQCLTKNYPQMVSLEKCECVCDWYVHLNS